MLVQALSHSILQNIARMAAKAHSVIIQKDLQHAFKL